jgi:galacturonokinase
MVRDGCGRLREMATRARDAAAAMSGRPAEEHSVVAVPYRVCPIGAHIDHQGGPVLGTAIDAYTVLAFAPADAGECRLASANYPGELRFSISSPAPSEEKGFGRYARAAAAALAADLPPRPRALSGFVVGTLPGGGLSSSASVLLAYLTAISEVNELALTPSRLVELTRVAENRFVGVRSGILDPATIVASRRGHLVAIDTLRSTWELVAPGRGAATIRFLVAFSGSERNLAATGFNERVEQCHRAARLLAARTEVQTAERLGDLPETALAELVDELPEVERRRARHFLEERTRVRSGVAAWRRGDFGEFGALMTDSCRSSIENFEVGSAELVCLQDILRETPGVLGSRFSGAGFGGCAVALVEEGRAEDCRERVEREYRASRPECAERARFFLVEGEDGIRRL